MTNEETTEVIQFLNDAWPRKPLTAGSVRIWGAKLSEYDYGAVMRILSDLVSTSEWMPALSDIEGPLKGETGGETAEEGYASVCQAFRRGEGSRADYLTDRTRAAVASLGGWGAIGQRADWDTWGRKAFIAAYESVVAVSVDRNRKALSSGPVRALGGEVGS